ncbi:HNH endonuclease [Bacillus cereus]|nr:HNH endonuclease [Bacillus cereus]
MKEDETLKLEENNLRLLCPVCHTIKENESKPKKSFSKLFWISPPIKK